MNNIDLEKLKNNPQLVNDLIEELRKKEWEELKTAKFQSSSPEELQIMETLWKHGFMKGAESASYFLAAVYAKVFNPSKNNGGSRNRNKN